ncbi:MAG: hypothetical protein IKO72_06605 [Kiritimatiellae bacterium]|nr:hypothetical protein [Kiritimatiellia bacterium]
MSECFSFSLKEIRSEVDAEQIGFKLYGDKAKPVHFAAGFFRCILGEYSTADLLSRLVYVVNARGQVKKGCEIDVLMTELKNEGVVEHDVNRDDLQSLRGMMQSLLSSDSAVFGEKGGLASYSAASSPFVTAKATYEEVGEIGAGILKEACPELIDVIEGLLKDKSDEISILFDPVPCEMVSSNSESGELPKWVSRAKKQPAWRSFTESVRRSGLILRDNIQGIPKLLAIRTIVHFAIFHLLRYLAKQEAFHSKSLQPETPLIAVYSKKRQISLVSSSRSSFLQIGQSMARFYASMYAVKLGELGYDYKTLLSINKAPCYDKKKALTRTDRKKADQNNEVWKTAKSMSQEEGDPKLALLRLGQSIHDMVATASDVSPLKYIRGIGLKTGLLYPSTSRTIPYFRFTQDITAMLVLSSTPKGDSVPGDEFLANLRNNFDVVTGALEDDFDFCSTHLRTMNVDEDELSKNGEAFIEQVCDMGYGKILADGIFRLFIGE